MTTDLWAAIQPPLPGMPGTNGQGSIYFMWDGRLYIKIGHTVRPVKIRGGELRSIEIMSIPGPMFEEKRLHRRYQALRQGTSEWFWPGDPLLSDLFYLAGKLKDERAYALLCKIRRAGTWRPGKAA
jgi:hypothetical protein